MNSFFNVFLPPPPAVETEGWPVAPARKAKAVAPSPAPEPVRAPEPVQPVAAKPVTVKAAPVSYGAPLPVGNLRQAATPAGRRAGRR